MRSVVLDVPTLERGLCYIITQHKHCIRRLSKLLAWISPEL